MYSEGLDDLHKFFDQFVRMTNNIGMGVSINLVKNFNDEVLKANSLESKCVMKKMGMTNDNKEERRINDFNIDFEETSVKVCCNTNVDSCRVF